AREGRRGPGSPAHAAAPPAAFVDRGIRVLRLLPPPLRRGEHCVVSKIEMQRCYGYIPLLNRAKVGRVLTRPFNRATTNPIDLTPPRILHWLQRIRVHASTKPRQPNAPDVITTQWRQVDVQQGVLGKRRQ